MIIAHFRLFPKKNLRYTRENLGVKQKDLITLFDVTYSTISGWETVKDTIPLKQLIKYTNKYNFSLDYLFALTNTNKSYFPLEIDLNTISKNLITIRKKHHNPQEQIAKILNTSSGDYAHYENSRYLIPTNFIYNLTIFYKDFSIDKTLGREEKICN